jgi:hypothetical protein
MMQYDIRCWVLNTLDAGYGAAGFSGIRLCPSITYDHKNHPALTTARYRARKNRQAPGKKPVGAPEKGFDAKKFHAKG